MEEGGEGFGGLDVMSYLRGGRRGGARGEEGCFILNGLKVDIAELQTAVDAWIKMHGVRYFNELTNMAILTEEVGELARVVARKYGEQSYKEGERDNLGEELADVLWVVVCLANQTGVDLNEAMEANFAKKTARDGTRHKKNPKLRRG